MNGELVAGLCAQIAAIDAEREELTVKHKSLQAEADATKARMEALSRAHSALQSAMTAMRFLNGEIEDMGKTTPLSVAIDTLLDGDPRMTKEQILASLVKSGFDFGGISPGRAVHMTVANRGRGR